MESISISLVNHSFQRKVKPIQNLSLIIAGGLWLIILPLLFLGNESLARAAGYLIIFSGVPIVIFLLLSIPFLFSNKTGSILLKDNQLIIGKNSYDLGRVLFKLNIDQSDWDDTSKSYTEKIHSLPKWGNYLIVNKNEEFEFLPDRKIEKYLLSIKISGYEKRPALMVKTADLFNSLMSMLWAAS